MVDWCLGGGGCVDIGPQFGWLVGCWPVAWTAVCWIADGCLAGEKEVGEGGRLIGVMGDVGEGVRLCGYKVMGSFVGWLVGWVMVWPFVWTSFRWLLGW